jgi:hypothetical protein
MTKDFKAILIAARPGDTVFIRLPSEPNATQREAIQAEMKALLPTGVKAGVLGPTTEIVHVRGAYDLVDDAEAG